jgi:hypothetical protein
LTLTDITLNEIFTLEVIEYSASVDFPISSTTVNAITNDKNATITIKKGATDISSDSVDLDAGENSIQVKITAEDAETTKTYTVSVSRLNQNTVPTSGGTFEFEDDISVVVPEGAFSESTTLMVSGINETEINTILIGTELISDSVIGGFYGEMDGTGDIIFSEPITVRIQVSPPQTANSILLHSVITDATDSVEIIDTDIVYDPVNGTAELQVSGFSTHTIVEGDQSWEATFDPTWDPQSFDCKRKLKNGMVIGTKTVEDDCKCGKQRTETKHHDFTSTEGCQAIRSVVRITYTECSTLTYWEHLINEVNSKCEGKILYAHDSNGHGVYCSDLGLGWSRICSAAYWKLSPHCPSSLSDSGYTHTIVCQAEITSSCGNILDPPVKGWSYSYYTDYYYNIYKDQVCLGVGSTILNPE